MYRKKNAAEKATDAENATIAANEEHRIVGTLSLRPKITGQQGMLVLVLWSLLNWKMPIAQPV